MKVLIFSGGSGPSALQEGIIKNYPHAKITLVLNAYDNGKSTGDIRKVFGGEILGPSDVRKNQSRMHFLETGSSDVSEFLEYRFEAKRTEEAKEIIFGFLEELKENSRFLSEFEFMKDVLVRFFDSVPVKEFSDYSIGNILYGQLAHENRNSLQSAADIMKGVLGLKSSIILNSDESLYLKGKTKKGVFLDCEAKIVDWNSDDRITEVFLENLSGERVLPEVQDSFVKEILDSDMIILSTGTQWSSLIPTYMSTYNGEPLKEIFNKSEAKKYLLINGKPDLDMIGLNGNEILEVLGDYLNLSDFKIVSGENYMKPTKTDVLILTISEKYEPDILVKEIFWDYFENPGSDDVFCFDWDGTLAILPEPSGLSSVITENKNLIKDLNSVVISGNTHEVIDTDILLYAEGGLVKHTNGSKTTLFQEHEFQNSELKEIIEFLGEFSSKVSVRENVCITIKPLSGPKRQELHEKLIKEFPEYSVQITGKTTIDIFKVKDSKKYAFDDFTSDLKNKRIFYIGDEILEGNDSFINAYEEVIKIPVKSTIETNSFLRTIKVKE